VSDVIELETDAERIHHFYRLPEHLHDSCRIGKVGCTNQPIAKYIRAKYGLDLDDSRVEVLLPRSCSVERADEIERFYARFFGYPSGWSYAGIMAARRSQHAVKDTNGKSVIAVRAGKAGGSASMVATTPEERSQWGRQGARAAHAVKDERGKSVCAVNCGRASQARRTAEEKSAIGRRLGLAVQARRTPEERSEYGRRAHRAMRALKDENGKSINCVNGGKAAAAVVHALKDERGKSIAGVRAAAITHAKKDERGKSIVGVKAGKAAGKVTAAMRRTCHHCGRKMSPSNLIQHLRKVRREEKGK
jgi:hypothetical protein